MHNKAWIADCRLAVVGGRNVGDAYFDADPDANFRDLDVLALGPAVRQAEAVFDGYWNSRAVIPIGALGKRREADLPALRAALAGAIDHPQARPYLDRVARNAAIGGLLPGERLSHVTAKPRIGPERKSGW